jgi:SWI/SNF-related matrix-associated actin-dependent regulator 1 of chromatin subfamily A
MNIPLPLEMPSKYKREYMKVVKDTIAKIRKMEAERKPVAAEHMVLIEKLKQVTARGKLDMVIEWTKDVIENEKLIIFCTHTEIVDKLLEQFADVAVEITGRIPVGPKRDAMIDAFMNDPTKTLCIANIQAGGVGLTLTSASKVLFMEFPWNPKDIDQASDRVHRIGQEENVMIYYAAAAETIDEMIVDVLIQKAHIIDEIMDGEASDDLSVIKEVVERFMREAEQLEMEF